MMIHNLTYYWAAALAVSEDRADLKIPLDGELRRVLMRMTSNTGRWPGLLQAMERCIECGLGALRLHANVDVMNVSRALGVDAFCLGSDVFLGPQVCGADGQSPNMAVLLHEIVHVLTRKEDRAVRAWGWKDHADLSEKALLTYETSLRALLSKKHIGISMNSLIEGVRIASSNMDVRQRFIHPWDTLKYLIGIDKGEGPRHGEGLNYTDSAILPNQIQNEAEQRKHIAMAVREFLDDAKKADLSDYVGRDRIGTLPFDIGPVAVGEKEWVKSLGNAFHVAQDRASHREGRKGYGHSDPRSETSPLGNKWCDTNAHDHSMGGSWWRCSGAAYNHAVNNSLDVICDFLRGVGLHAPDPIHIPESCGAQTTQGFQYEEEYEALNVFPNPFNKSVRGRLPRPYGLRKHVGICRSNGNQP